MKITWKLAGVSLFALVASFSGASASAQEVGSGVGNASSASYYSGVVRLSDVNAGGCDAGCGAAGCGTEGAGCGCKSACDSACNGCGCSSACDSGCDSCGGCGCSCYIFGPDEPWKLFPANDCRRTEIGGWVQLGYHSAQTPNSAAPGDLLAFNDLPNRLNLHQAWVYAERVAEGDCCGWDWGYRVDFMYGTDAQKTQAFGNSPAPAGPANGYDNNWDNGFYGFALPQAYLEVARGDLSVKVGHFYTLVGYEVVPAPGNFFYSHALTMFNSEPFTHTGALASYQYSDDLELYFGWTLGWDTGFAGNNGSNSWLGGFSYSFSDDASLTYISTAGNLGWRGTRGYSQSVLLDFQLTERLNYVVLSDWVAIQADAVNNGVGNDQTSLVQYAFYEWNDCIKFGGRFEWWKSDGQSQYEVTGGINWFPIANLAIRPEIRYDFIPNNVLDRTTFGVDCYVTW